MYTTKTSWNRAKKTLYGDKRYDSGFEASYAMELDSRARAGEIKGYERQQKIPLLVNGYHICNYYIDFTVYHNDGTIEYVETKGHATEVWKLKWKVFEAMFGSDEKYKLTVVYQGKHSKLRKPKVYVAPDW